MCQRKRHRTCRSKEIPLEEITMKKKEDSHYVSYETPAGQCVPVDTDHAVIVEGHGVPMNSEVTKDQTKRKHEVGTVELGAPDNRETVKTKVGERHIQSEP